VTGPPPAGATKPTTTRVGSPISRPSTANAAANCSEGALPTAAVGRPEEEELQAGQGMPASAVTVACAVRCLW
jgi:hypothetical protein